MWTYDPKTAKDISGDFNPFWKDLISHWSDISASTQVELDTDDILKQTIWYNSNIKVNNVTIFYKEFYYHGIWYINDLMNEHGGILSYDEFKSLYQVNTNFVVYQL